MSIAAVAALTCDSSARSCLASSSASWVREMYSWVSAPTMNLNHVDRRMRYSVSCIL